MQYHPFLHVERIDSDECAGLLNGQVYITPKIDGTNSCIFYDKDKNKIVCGSRKRTLSADNDNAGFAAWFAAQTHPEAQLLKEFVENNTNLQVFGEWLGSTKFIGHIKDYSTYSLGELHIFDIYDFDQEKYLHYNDIYFLLREFGIENYLVPLLAVLDDPSMEEIAEVAEHNHYLLENANHPGEGVVCRNYDFINKYGRYTVGKLVREEYKQKKSEKKKQPSQEGEIETNIVELYVTDAEITKAIEKATVLQGEWNKKNSKCISTCIQLVWHDSVLEEMPDIVKKFKNPTINFRILNAATISKVRQFLGL